MDKYTIYNVYIYVYIYLRDVYGTIYYIHSILFHISLSNYAYSSRIRVQDITAIFVIICFVLESLSSWTWPQTKG